jgi:hypothetical protein
LKANGLIEMVQRPGIRGMVAYVRERPSNVTYLRTTVIEIGESSVTKLPKRSQSMPTVTHFATI